MDLEVIMEINLQVGWLFKGCWVYRYQFDKLCEIQLLLRRETPMLVKETNKAFYTRTVILI